MKIVDFRESDLWRRENVHWNEVVMDDGSIGDPFSIDDPFSPTTSRNADFQMMVKSLSNASKDIVRIVFDIPEDFREALAGYNNVKVTMNKLKKYLCSIGWRKNKIDHCFNEIREGLRSLN